MDCPVCPVTVKKAIENIEGVVAVTVDFQAKMATVIFDDDVTSTDEVAQASANAGYPATLIQTDSG
jgi:mercuric ion binding protein